MNTETKKDEAKGTASDGKPAEQPADTVISPAEAERLYQEELNKPETTEAKPNEQTAADKGGPAVKTPEAKGQQPEITITDDDVKLLDGYGVSKENATPKLVERLRQEKKERDELERKFQDAEAGKKLISVRHQSLSKQYQELKEKLAADPSTAVDAVRSMLKDMPLDKLPEKTRALLQDEDFQAAVAVVAGNLARKNGTKEPAPEGSPDGALPSQPQAPQMSMEEIKARADEIEAAVRAAHPDFDKVYGSPEFGEWFKTQPDNVRVKISLPRADSHIELVTAFKKHVAAKQSVDEQKAKDQAAKDALRGSGHIGSKGAASEDNLTAEDIMKMSDDEFKKLDQRVLSGGVRR